MSKIQSWELFTTEAVEVIDPSALCEICQRYNLESYSQPILSFSTRHCSCVRYVKDTILRAIHNSPHELLVGELVVWDMSKIQSWELFTTIATKSLSPLKLCEICQRYNLESYSQPTQCNVQEERVVWDMSKIQSWELFTTLNVSTNMLAKLCEICQRYNLESYSQRYKGSRNLWRVVWDMSKIQSWELFTTSTCCNNVSVLLCEICQRYNLESYSQHGGDAQSPGKGCVRYVKDTILRAIHNRNDHAVSQGRVVWDMSKIQSWELFTTQMDVFLRLYQLCEICQRYNLESYSQLLSSVVLGEKSCVRYVKDTILRAIHNLYLTPLTFKRVVWDMSKIQSWELFTTMAWNGWVVPSLCEICQRYNLESYSQRLVTRRIYHVVVWDMSKIQSWELFTTRHLLCVGCYRCVRYVKDTILRAIHNSNIDCPPP